MIPLHDFMIFSLLLKLFNFSIFFQVLVDSTGFSPSIPFLFSLNSLAGCDAGIIFLPCLISLSHWHVQDAHYLADIVIQILSMTTTILTCAVGAVCGPR